MTFTPTVPYADQAWADAYMAEKLRVDVWTNAVDSDKVAALKMATNAIDQLNFAGDKADSAQVAQFPRGGDTTVPVDIMKATCELAFAFIDDRDADLEIESANVRDQSIGSASVGKDTGLALDHIAAGIPSIRAWTFLVPYLRDPRILDVDRV